jgi:hypothetical protein
MMVEYGVANNRLLLRQFVNPVDEVTRAVTGLGDFWEGIFVLYSFIYKWRTTTLNNRRLWRSLCIDLTRSQGNILQTTTFSGATYRH